MTKIVIKKSGDKWIAERQDNGNIVGYSDNPDRLQHELQEMTSAYVVIEGKEEVDWD